MADCISGTCNIYGPGLAGYPGHFITHLQTCKDLADLSQTLHVPGGWTCPGHGPLDVLVLYG